MTPLVRKLAAEHGVDLASVTGTGRRRPDPQAGRARRAPRRPKAAEAAPAPAAAPAAAGAAAEPAAAPRRRRRCAGTTEKLPRLRTVIAKRMVESLQVSAQLTTVVEVDVTRIARLRARAKDDFQARRA